MHCRTSRYPPRGEPLGGAAFHAGQLLLVIQQLAELSDRLGGLVRFLVRDRQQVAQAVIAGMIGQSLRSRFTARSHSCIPHSASAMCPSVRGSADLLAEHVPQHGQAGVAVAVFQVQLARSSAASGRSCRVWRPVRAWRGPLPVPLDFFQPRDLRQQLQIVRLELGRGQQCLAAVFVIVGARDRSRPAPAAARSTAGCCGFAGGSPRPTASSAPSVGASLASSPAQRSLSPTSADFS